MSRRFWLGSELEDLARYQDDYPSFHALWPDRTYDSWEVRRRRLDGGTAGTRIASLVSATLVLRATRALHVLTDFVESVALPRG